MSAPGTGDQPLRVAIVGSGPAGFYTAEHLFRSKDVAVTVDMFDRLPTPFGLVRFGVAPDHQKIKSVTRVFDRVARRPGFRFFGNVEFGTHLALEDLQRHYHRACFATGAQTDRRLGIPGEDLLRSHPATEFVAWYNGHPDYRHLEFDLSARRAAVVGIGNVAVDVARILCRTPQELEATDIADHALAALRASGIREVFLLGRRGPAQAAFTNAEIKELGELPGADVTVPPDEATLDPLSAASLEQSDDADTLRRKVAVIAEFARRPPAPKPKRLTLRFLVSPVELVGDDAGRVRGMRMVKNRLYASQDGSLRPRSTEQFETLPVDLVFRSVGYRGVALLGLPFDEQRGTVPNVRGRVTPRDSADALAGLYVSGWIKRGPTGVIGTNKPDAAETVACMLEDRAWGVMLRPSQPEPEAARRTVLTRQPRSVSYEEWCRLDAVEEDRGKAAGRPRVKFTSVDEMLQALAAAE